MTDPDPVFHGDAIGLIETGSVFTISLALKQGRAEGRRVSEDSKPGRNRWVVAALIILPLWLAVSAGLGLWKFYHDSKKEELVEPSKFATPVDGDRIASDMRKLVEIIGPRHVRSEAGAKGLRQAASMIRGALGPGNAGYRVEVKDGPESEAGSWPTIVATLPGEGTRPLWVVAAYDTHGIGVEASSSGVASVLAVARSLALEEPRRPVKFAFLPHGYDADAPVLPLLDEFSRAMGKPDLVLVVEAMGSEDELVISSRDASALSTFGFEKHGRIVGAEAVCLEDDFDLASILFELNQAAVRVATRRVVGEGMANASMPDAATHAAATQRLAELVMDLAK